VLLSVISLNLIELSVILLNGIMMTVILLSVILVSRLCQYNSAGSLLKNAIYISHSNATVLVKLLSF
jgi:hypothetical protein